jgi:hypothetical protein
LAYRYAPQAFARAPEVAADTLYIAGGLYGNEQALDAIAAMHATEADAALIFNGDFNWFNAEPDAFGRINRRVLDYSATRGNVETELASVDETAGCGCGYPHWVSDGEVERSNAIMQRLRAVACEQPDMRARLAALPTHLVARVGAVRVAIVHGDLESLAGWMLAQESLQDEAHCARIARQMHDANVRIVASSHTCLPVALPVAIDAGVGAVINNGAAGMPNFSGRLHGVMTRISLRASRAAPLYALRVGELHVEALAVHYDHERFLRGFERCWALDSPAYRSYYRRIVAGPDYTMTQAVRHVARPEFIRGDPA